MKESSPDLKCCIGDYLQMQHQVEPCSVCRENSQKNDSASISTFFCFYLNFFHFYILTTVPSLSPPPTPSPFPHPTPIHSLESVRLPMGVNKIWHIKMRQNQDPPPPYIKAEQGIPLHFVFCKNKHTNKNLLVNEKSLKCGIWKFGLQS